MTFEPDYPGATVIEAHRDNYGYGNAVNLPRALVLHTPEEPADAFDSTPVFFQDPRAGVSTHFFGNIAGEIVQMVPVHQGAYAQGVTWAQRIWKGNQGQLPPWAGSENLNLWAISFEMEGYAASIHNSMPRGSGQWRALVAWIKYMTTKYNIPRDRDHVVGHDDVASHKRDPGSRFQWNLLMEDIQPPAVDRSSVTAALYSARESIAQALIYIEGPVPQTGPDR